jgi:hypothetical protein
MPGRRSWKVGVLWLAGEPRVQVLAGGHGRVDGVVAGELRVVMRVTRVCRGTTLAHSGHDGGVCGRRLLAEGVGVASLCSSPCSG